MITISIVIPDTPPFSFISSACPNEWKAFEANCYRVYEGARPWNLAEIFCQKILFLSTNSPNTTSGWESEVAWAWRNELLTSQL